MHAFAGTAIGARSDLHCGKAAANPRANALTRNPTDRDNASVEVTGVTERTQRIPAAAAHPVDVILRDGTTLRLRPPMAADRGRLVDFFRALSTESLYRRFHSLPSVDARLVEPVLDPDWDETGALIGTTAVGGERVVALASYARLRDPAVAEVAFAVADEYQGRGIGTRLLEQLAERAGSVGVERFVAEVLADNRAMLRVFEDAGFEVTRELEQGEVEATFPIRATEAVHERIAERDHVAVVASMRSFFEPRRVAVVGASPRSGTIGGELFRNVLRAGFRGVAYPVNRTSEPVDGVGAYRAIDEIDEPIDLAVFCLPAENVLPAAEEALAQGVRALCVISAGFAEIGPEGAERQERLLTLVRSHGARMIGPNCLGIASSRARLNATFAPRELPPGRIGFSSQSGALGLALLEQADQRGLGFSAFVSIGNKADVSTNDLLEHWEDDEDTGLVVLYVESFGNPHKFGRLARRVARHKPVLAMKSGTTRAGRRAAGSHTAALAGSEAAVEALFHQAGVIRASTLEQLLDSAVLLSSQPLPRGRRVAVLTNAGGLGILAADACEGAGLELPQLSPQTRAELERLLPDEASVENPVDMLGSATAASYATALPVVLSDPRVDAVIVVFVPPVVATAADVAQAIARCVRGDKPVLAVVVSAEGIPSVLRGQNSVAAFAFPESAAQALGLAAKRAEWLRRPAGSVPALEGVDLDTARRVVAETLRAADDVWLRPEQARRVLAAFGVPLVAEQLVDDPDGAVAAATDLGFPVVVKTAAPGAHKTETGGVALDLTTAEAVRAAAERIGGPLLVQPLVTGGVELLAGVVQDPVFGALVAFGPGGVLAELIGEAGFRIAPLTDVDAEELVDAGKAGRLVAGFRGRPPADAAALADLLHRLSALGAALPEVAELDLNPVLGLECGCVAVDARLRVRRPEPVQRTKTW
jgi:acetate---CoA ligase (ADP-forming)